MQWYEYVLTPSDHSVLLPDLHSHGQKHKQKEQQQKKSVILNHLRIKNRKWRVDYRSFFSLHQILQ